MGRTRTAEDTPDVATVTKTPVPEMPEWATRPQEDSEMVLYVPPSANQWRRLLRPDELMQWVSDRVDTEGGFSKQDILELFARAASATSTDTLLSDQETLKGRTIPGVILAVARIRFKRGTFEDGCPYFTLFDATRTDTNESEVISVGGWVVCAQAAQLHYLTSELPEGSPYLVDPETEGAIGPWTYPLYLKIKQRDTAAGFKVNSLVHPMVK